MREAPRHREDEDIEALIERHAEFPNPPICLGVGLVLGDDSGVGLGLGSKPVPQVGSAQMVCPATILSPRCRQFAAGRTTVCSLRSPL